MSKKYYRLIIESDEDEWHGYCPDLPGLHVGGKNPKDTLRNMGMALSAYMLSLSRHGDPLPPGYEGMNFREIAKEATEGVTEGVTEIESMSIRCPTCG